MSDVIGKQIIAFVFKRKGTRKISESDFYLTISMQLQWCPPHLAKKFVHYAVQDGLLVKKDGLLSAGFSINETSIPVGFKPSSDFFETYKPRQSSLDQGEKQDLQSYIKNSSSSENEVEKEINHLIEKKRISKPVALLLYAKRNNIPIDDFFDAVEEELITENKG